MIQGPPGSGRSHLLDALAGTLDPGRTLRCSPRDADWRVIIGQLGIEPELRVLVDDLDGYDDHFREQLFKVAARQHHRMAASTTVFGGRIARVWKAHLIEPETVRLESVSERPEDVGAFLPHWARLNRDVPQSATFSETHRIVMAMNLPRGFHDLVRLFEAVTTQDGALWDPPDGSIWITAYTEAVMAVRPTRPVILLEGRSDAVYFEWAAGFTNAPDDVEFEACQSARKIPERAIACRNEGRLAVALFDNDLVGQDVHKQMRSFDLGSVLIPVRFDPLANYAPDHVRQGVEIEDLIPVVDLERFYAESRRVPELVIDAPRKQARRIVVHADDKLDLALWVSQSLAVGSAGLVIEAYNELRTELRLAPAEILGG